ncbi:MAG TPA: DUF4262 domain-containing protein [Mycobacteriales bacterium]|nr:DUF4262 domain-containing protein [Mycobacteriales bacterium]
MQDDDLPQLPDPDEPTELQLRQFADQHAAHLRDLIAEHGWAVQGVIGDHEHPSVSYTVGLTRYHGHPELVVVGLGNGGGLLNLLGERVKAGERLRAGQVIQFERATQRVCFVTVENPEPLIYANELYQWADGPPVPALQVVWADPAGWFPWEEEYAVSPRTQPLLGPLPESLA